MCVWWLLCIAAGLLGASQAKWVEGWINTKENWSFLARFCFLSLEGQFEYLIEFDRDLGVPNLLLYYDDESQWPSVYHSGRSCKDRESVLNRNGQNQIIRLSHWYPETELSGCIVRKQDKEMPAQMSTTPSPQKNTTKKPKHEPEQPLNSSYYDQFLKTTPLPRSTVDSNFTTWYETEDNTTAAPEEWESIGGGNASRGERDVEILFAERNGSRHKIKRSTFELYERYRRRRLHAESPAPAQMERLVVTCHNSRRFRSARERWWFIAVSNCDSPKGLDIRYKFLMTNGPEGDFWHEHFSADEFYVLPVLLAYVFAYLAVVVAAVVCSVELKSRRLLHVTYKVFLWSTAAQHLGASIQALAYTRYAINGRAGSEPARITGQFLCGVSEMLFMLLLILMAKGYTITRGRLKLGFTVRLTVFMCCYLVTFVVLFIYQAKAFDPGEVLYLYESPAGYGIIALRLTAWCVFAHATFYTVKKHPEKNMFYCPFFICGTLWFYAGAMFILTANSYIDKWVRESVVIAVLMFITFCGHVMFLLLTLPVFANKNFPYHVRTTQIGVMEVNGSAALENFGPNAYHPSSGAAQTVIIPLTRRTEELIGNMYNQYMATAPPIENGTPKLNGLTKSHSLSPKTLVPQDSVETNTSDDITPYVAKTEPEIFTVENQMAKIEAQNLPSPVLPHENLPSPVLPHENLPNGSKDVPILRSRRNILEPIKREEVPSWSLAKGPSVVAMLKKNGDEEGSPELNGAPASTSWRKVPPVRNGLQASSGEISTIREGQVQSYRNTVSKATIDLFSVASK